MSETPLVHTLLKRLEDHQNKYNELKKDMIELDSIINQLTKLIYDNCDHDWVIDHTVSDHTRTYVCVKCNLIR